jgi:hypothetical protein
VSGCVDRIVVYSYHKPSTTGVSSRPDTNLACLGFQIRNDGHGFYRSVRYNSSGFPPDYTLYSRYFYKWLNITLVIRGHPWDKEKVVF